MKDADGDRELLRNNREEAIAGMVVTVIGVIIAAVFAYVTVFIGGRDHPYFEIVRGRGFVVTGSSSGCMVKNEKLEPDALDFLELPEARVHVTIGDSDWV